MAGPPSACIWRRSRKILCMYQYNGGWAALRRKPPSARRCCARRKRLYFKISWERSALVLAAEDGSPRLCRIALGRMVADLDARHADRCARVGPSL
eukprot:366262-Chlamydomonas_euryale.AAC.3